MTTRKEINAQTGEETIVPLTAEEMAAAQPDPIVLANVTRAQAKIALLRAGKLGLVKQAIAQADEETKLWYDEATTWRRNAAPVAALGAAIGLSPADIDNLFVVAAGVDA